MAKYMGRFFVVALVYLIPIFAVWISAESKNIWLSTQTMAIVLTGLVVIWYTIETYLLRNETQKQTELQQRPFVLAKLQDNKLCLTNYGPGVSINTYVKPIMIDEGMNVKIKFEEKVPVIKANESVCINAESFDKNGSKGDFFVAHLDPENAVYDLITEIHYENIEGKRYKTKQKSSPKDQRILGIETK